MLTKGFIRFNSGLVRSPVRVKLWALALAIVNLFAPLFFFQRLEALFTLAAMFLSMILTNLIAGITGYSRLLGLGHLPWIPLVAWLATRLDSVPPDTDFGMWLRAVIVLNTISLVIDTFEVIRYLRGDRNELIVTVSHLPETR